MLEANCSLALAEGLLLDGWGASPDPEGRQEESELVTRGLAPWLSPIADLSGTPRPGHPSESRCAPTVSPGPYYCNATLDQIGTCWPQSAPGAVVERPCPEYFNGIKYNTTRECPSLVECWSPRKAVQGEGRALDQNQTLTEGLSGLK